MADDTEMIPEAWKATIRRQFVKFKDNLSRQDEIVDELYGEEIISAQQKERVSAMTESYKKSDFLFFEVLTRLSISNYNFFKQLLIKHGMKHVAQSLPGELSVQGRTEEFINKQENAVCYSVPLVENTKTAAAPDRSAMTPPVSPEESANKGMIQQTSPIDKYSFHRKGLVVVFSFFTEDLKGYKTDLSNIKALFRKEKGKYDIKCYENLCKESFERKMHCVVDELEKYDDKDDGPTYDRLIYFVLSHGDQGGIKTCCSDGITEEPECRIDPQWIINHFKLKTLKNRPKYFVFQYCRGTEVTKTAATSQSDPKERFKELKAQQRSFIPEDADILVSYACMPGTISSVGEDYGSWLIRSLCNVLKKHHQKRPIDDLLKLVNSEVAVKVNEDEEKVLRQMPCHFTTLRKDFFLFE